MLERRNIAISPTTLELSVLNSQQHMGTLHWQTAFMDDRTMLSSLLCLTAGKQSLHPIFNLCQPPTKWNNLHMSRNNIADNHAASKCRHKSDKSNKWQAIITHCKLDRCN